ncbi:MAG: right-handed parallel beta-helix repeat-containing protein [Gammaproteobacteria bacterium]|nr:right-handed parallel beta-helix repeat-containing protein [Gammaproteobacteria bacterium]
MGKLCLKFLSVLFLFGINNISGAETLSCSSSTVLCVDDAVGATQEYSTIQAAVDVAQPGDTVLVYDGNYRGFSISASGTSVYRITIKAQGTSAVIDSANDNGEGITLSNASYITIDGFTITGMPRYGVAAHNASPTNPMHGITLRNNIVQNSNSSNIYLSEVADSLIEKNIASGSIASHGIYLANAGSDRTILRGNRCFNNAKAGIHFNGDASVGGDGYQTGLTVAKNIIYNNKNNGLDMDGVGRSTIKNNLVYNNTPHALRSYQIDAAQGPKNLRIFNNTFVVPNGGGWAIKLTADQGGHTIFNNILMNNGSNGSIVVSNSNFVSNSNVVTGKFSLDGESTIIDLPQWQSQGYDSNSLISTSASLFMDMAAGNYDLKNGAVAIDHGTSVLNYVYAPSIDIRDVVRPQGTTYDIGAYESLYIGSSAPPPEPTPAPSPPPPSSSGGSSTGSSTPTDTTPPSVSITSPTSSTTYTASSNTLSLAGTAADDVAVTQVSWSNSLGGSGTASGTTSWSVGSIALQNGTNTITVTARDAAGNSSVDTLSVSYAPSAPADTTPPTLTITAPTSNTTYAASSNTLNLAGTAADNVGVTQVSWSNSLGGSGTASGTTSWSVASIALQNGTNTITLTARDAAGNNSSDTLSVTYSSGAISTPVTRTTFYLAPNGNDSANTGKSLSSPWKTFSKAFTNMKAGDELILLDGAYSESAGTGYISYLGNASAQPPSGTNISNMTYVHALNPGNVVIQGGLFIGRSTRKDSFIKIQGITFEGGGDLYNTSYVTVKDCGFHGAFGIGTNDHDYGNDYDLIEDVWIWAQNERIIAINYRASHNVWRRVLVRGDGCGTSACSGSGNPNVGITVYNSTDVSLQNVIVVDRILGGGSPYADFAVAQHDPGPIFGRAEWLGTLSLNSPDNGYYMEPDAATDPSIKISNAVAWDAAGGGFNIARNAPSGLLENLTAYGRGDDGVRVAPELTSGILRNVISTNSGHYGINSAYTLSYVDVYSAAYGAYNQTSCSVACYTSNPRADGATPSLKYLTRIEAGSLLNGKGFGGADIGANILYRYGADGARFGDAGYNTLSSTSLWPWPNEDRIKREMCAGTTRGFCATGQRLGNVGPVTLTTYIWEYLGSPIPLGIYP